LPVVLIHSLVERFDFLGNRPRADAIPSCDEFLPMG
jgi:hypothetical protein